MNYTTDQAAWVEATDGLRKMMQADALTRIETEVRAARADKVKPENVWNQGQVEKATSQARGVALRAIAEMVEYQGVRNPQHTDPNWAPNSVEVTKAQDVKANRYAGACVECGSWVEAEQGALVKNSSGKWAAQHTTCPPKTETPAPAATETAPVSGLDLSGLPSGYFAVPDGDTRLKVHIQQGKPGTKWDGYTFVKDGATYGEFQSKRYGMQRPGQAYNGGIQDQLTIIAADPKAAAVAYGRLVGRCGICGAKLENADSVAAGIGPICAQGF